MSEPEQVLTDRAIILVADDDGIRFMSTDHAEIYLDPSVEEFNQSPMNIPRTILWWLVQQLQDEDGMAQLKSMAIEHLQNNQPKKEDSVH